MENSKGEKIDKNFTIYAENIRKLKEQEVKNKIKREKVYARLLDSQYLEEEFLNILKRILSLKDKFISLLDILSIGSENDLGEYDFAFDLNKGWSIYLNRFPEDNFFQIAICNKYDASYTCILSCVFYLDKKCIPNGRIYIDGFLSGEFTLKQTPIIFGGIFNSGHFNDTYLRIFLLDLKNVDIEDYFFKSLKELEKEIAERI